MNDSVKTEISAMESYSGNLNQLKQRSFAGTVLIYHRVEQIKEDLENKLYTLKRLQYISEEKCRYIDQLYQTIIHDAGEESRSVIGSSDIELNQIKGDIDIRIEMLENNVRMLQTLLENVFQHTKNYELQIDNMVDSCRKKLSDEIQSLIEYINKKQH